MVANAFQSDVEAQLIHFLLTDIDSGDDIVVEWESLIALSIHHWVTGLLAHNIAFIKHIPPMARQLLDTYRTICIKEALQQEATILQIQQLLDAHGIPCVWLKGTWLRYAIYPLPWTRRMQDVDVLVHKHDLQFVSQLLKGTDFHVGEMGAETDDAFIEYSHHITLVSPHEVNVEVHHDLFWQQYGNLTVDWAWQYQQSFEIGDTVLQTLTPEAMFIHLCIHDIVHHANVPRQVSRQLDIHRLITSINLDWDWIVNEAHRLKVADVIQEGLQQVYQLFNTPLPYGVCERLDVDYKTPRMTNMQLKRWDYLQSIPTWQRKIAYLSYLIFPSKKHMSLSESLHIDDINAWTYLKRIIRKSWKLFTAIQHKSSNVA